MSEDKEPSKKLSLSGTRQMEPKQPVEAGQVRQSFSHGRSKPVMVEVRKTRSFSRSGEGRKEVTMRAAAVSEGGVAETPETEGEASAAKARVVLRSLTEDEKATRVRALEEATKDAVEVRRQAEEDSRRFAEDERRLAAEREAADKRGADEEERKRKEDEARRRAEEDAAKRLMTPEALAGEGKEGDTPGDGGRQVRGAALTAQEAERARQRRRGEHRRPAMPRKMRPRRRAGKLTVGQALQGDERMRSLAAMRRQREKAQSKYTQGELPAKVSRDVVVPESITVQELGNRMAERSVDVVKALMKMGVMAGVTETIEGDTAELIVEEFGHRVKRVSEADVEIGLKGEADDEASLERRAPVVTVMGHVDHGKTTLLDALRETHVASGEAGGITQHIGAYQVEIGEGEKICFVDTPGHEAFTAMRARGAGVTDIVVLVVAADDGVMPQTVEAINHAKAAQVPIVVAINKIDRPDADPDKVLRGLLDHEIVVEKMGGEALCVEISAKEKENLDKLEEAILLQAELLDLTANPNRPADGVVIEAQMESGRGSVATLLVQRGTLRRGDIVVAGSEWGRVRALSDDRGEKIETAGPSVPAEIFGLNGTPEAGEDFVVVDSESRAREVAEFRQRGAREVRAAATARGTLDEMFSKIREGVAKELPVVIKGDVQGSIEALAGALEKMGTEEVAVRLHHSGVGGINEADVTLAKASGALIIGFNVRATIHARDLARRESVEILYYSVIYDVVDDIKGMLSGMLEPAIKENFLGNAEIREIFNITKVGKIAGCRVTEGTVRRGAKVRLLRDSVVIHEGALATLKRFKEEVKEVREGFECGMAFEKYQDIQIGDVIEAFEVEKVARSL